jgi:hypothetical protein
MANATVTVLEADGLTETDVVVLDVGRQAAAASKSVTLATEDKAVLDGILTDTELRATPVPVSGTITANLSATDNTVLDNIDSSNSRLTSSATNIDPGAQGGGTTTSFLSAGKFRTTQTTLTDGQTAALSFSARGAVMVNPGAEAFPVTNAGTFVAQVDGAALTALQLIDDVVLAEDDAHSTGNKGVMALAMRAAAPGDTSGTDGDYEPLQVSGGKLWVQDSVVAQAVADVETAVTTGGVTQVDHDATATGVQPLVGGGVASAAAPTSVSADGDAVLPWFLRNGAQAINITAAGALIPGDATNGLDIDVTRISAVAHDANTAENPVKVGFQAIAGLSGATLVAAADKTYGYAGIDGAQIMRPHCGLEDIVSGVAAITDGSSTSVIASAGAGVKNYITSAIIANSSATAVTVDIRDGAAGSVKATFPVPANVSGVVCNLPVPLPFSADTAVCADPSAAASTVTVTLIGFKSKV